MSLSPDRHLRLLVAGFCGASLAFAPSWFRILDSTWPAWILTAHAAALAAAGFVLTRRGSPGERAIIWLCVLAVLPVLFLTALRAASQPWEYVHDSTVQTEEAMRYLLEGKNPYVESYASGPMGKVPFWGGKNPALEHVVYYPGSFLLGLPVYALCMKLAGHYDHRLFLLLSHALALAGAWFAADVRWRRHLLVALGLNPAFLFYLAQGTNDSLVTGLLMPAIALASMGRDVLAAVLIGAAAGFKQTAWFFAPIYLAGLAGRTGFARAAAAGGALALTMALLTLPIVWWDPAAFHDDTVAYLMGTAKESYPPSGLSIASLLGPLAEAPESARRLFQGLQLFVVLPALLFFAWRQWRAPSAAGLLRGYSLAVTASFVCARYFNASHLAYCSLFFIASFYLPGPRASMAPVSPRVEDLPQ